MNKTSLIVVVIIVLLVVGSGAFYGGMVYGKSQNARSFSSTNFQGVRNGTRTGGTVGAGFISGDIISKDNTSITLQLPNNGGSKIIFYSDATQISKFASGTSADFVTGTAVNITGTTNSDGSVIAQSVQIRPAGLGSQNSGQ